MGFISGAVCACLECFWADSPPLATHNCAGPLTSSFGGSEGAVVERSRESGGGIRLAAFRALDSRCLLLRSSLLWRVGSIALAAFGARRRDSEVLVAEL